MPCAGHEQMQKNIQQRLNLLSGTVSKFCQPLFLASSMSLFNTDPLEVYDGVLLASIEIQHSAMFSLPLTSLRGVQRNKICSIL